jgi:hypothetical protein
MLWGMGKLTFPLELTGSGKPLKPDRSLKNVPVGSDRRRPRGSR